MKQYPNKTYLAGWEDHSIVLKIKTEPVLQKQLLKWLLTMNKE